MRVFNSSFLIKMTLVALLLIGGLAGVWYFIDLEKRIRTEFRDFKSSAPSRVYARAPVLYRGMDIIKGGLALHLSHVGYRTVFSDEVSNGEYMMGKDKWIIGIRPFSYANGLVEGTKVIITLEDNGRISSLHNEKGQELATVRIEPAEIAVFLSENMQDSKPVHLNEIPKHLINAAVTLEDRNFFNHTGIDFYRIASALITNLRAHKIIQGASTITQQLVKNLFLTRARTFTRKVQEIIIAILLELQYSKQEILEAYLNIIYLGQNGAVSIHGIGLASFYYFGKDIHDLNLSESALLVGLIRSPSAHDPFRNPEAARERRDFVLNQMLLHNKITKSEYYSAIDSPLVLRPIIEKVESSGYFVDFIRNELTERYGKETLEKGRLSIYTTLDLHLQNQAEQIIRNRLSNLEFQIDQINHASLGLQAAMIVVEPRTGQILVFIGGRDYKKSSYNRMLARRQPGSIFKPIVMLTALGRNHKGEPNFTLASLLKDEPLSIDLTSGKWEPMNHHRLFSGEVTVRTALEQSLNVPMLNLATAVGYTQIISTARRMGITSPLEPVPSLALGSFEVTLLEMSSVYAVLASGGIRTPQRSILRIIEPNGAIRRYSKVTPFRIFRSDEIYLVTSALQGGVDHGTSTTLRELGFYGPVAGKTGSTDRFHDAWFLGYTPEIVVGAWVGFDVGRDLGLSGAKAALPIVADFMINVLGRKGAARFLPPPGIEHVKVAIKTAEKCYYTGEYFLKGTVPNTKCNANIESKKYDK